MCILIQLFLQYNSDSRVGLVLVTLYTHPQIFKLYIYTHPQIFKLYIHSSLDIQAIYTLHTHPYIFKFYINSSLDIQALYTLIPRYSSFIYTDPQIFKLFIHSSLDIRALYKLIPRYSSFTYNKMYSTYPEVYSSWILLPNLLYAVYCVLQLYTPTLSVVY